MKADCDLGCEVEEVECCETEVVKCVNVCNCTSTESCFLVQNLTRTDFTVVTVREYPRDKDLRDLQHSRAGPPQQGPSCHPRQKLGH